MNKRIKIVWMLSILTMALILLEQGYWLYNQYQYALDEGVQQLKASCDSIIMQEEDMRMEQYYLKKGKNAAPADTIGYRYKLQIGDDSTKNLKNGHIDITYLPHNSKKERTVSLEGIGTSDMSRLTMMNEVSMRIPFQTAVVDSLLQASGYQGLHQVQFCKSRQCHIHPVYTVVKTPLTRNLHVFYTYSPFSQDCITFDISVPAKPALRSMAWQFATALAMLVVLAFCLFYQIRTIVFQKRIDKLRREFMKNMIYEMKQPPATDPEEAEAMPLGDTLFFYTLNELRHGTARVIITSRQAELLKLLAENQNTTVSREEILRQIWGDDSYSNSMALNVQITYLRRALKTDNRLSIEAVIRKGYVLKVVGTES